MIRTAASSVSAREGQITGGRASSRNTPSYRVSSRSGGGTGGRWRITPKRVYRVAIGHSGDRASGSRRVMIFLMEISMSLKIE